MGAGTGAHLERLAVLGGAQRDDLGAAAELDARVALERGDEGEHELLEAVLERDDGGLVDAAHEGGVRAELPGLLPLAGLPLPAAVLGGPPGAPAELAEEDAPVSAGLCVPQGGEGCADAEDAGVGAVDAVAEGAAEDAGKGGAEAAGEEGVEGLVCGAAGAVRGAEGLSEEGGEDDAGERGGEEGPEGGGEGEEARGGRDVEEAGAGGGGGARGGDRVRLEVEEVDLRVEWRAA